MSERPITDPQSTPPAPTVVDAAVAGQQRGRVNTSRRNFAKGGAAAPVVLGSLLSKPALAVQPYNCTISGQMSGNTSARPRVADCKTLGKSPGYWKTNATWPTGVIKGNAPTSTCSFGNKKGTNFNGFSSGGATLIDAFRYRSDTTACNCYGLRDPAFTTCSTTYKASMLQVLNTPGGLNDTMIYALGRATVATILNALQYGPDYPVTVAQAIKMFNATARVGGKYQVNSSVFWDDNQVLTYFQSLYS